MVEKEIHEELVSIRRIMERSVKFNALSGLAGVLAGFYAVIVCLLVYFSMYGFHVGYLLGQPMLNEKEAYYRFTVSALFVLMMSLVTAVLLTIRQAKMQGVSFQSVASMQVVSTMATPLVIGGILMLALFFRHEWSLLPSVSLVFYGLALVSTGKYTFPEVTWLGYLQVVAGLIAAFLPTFGLLCWIVGFGVLHILFGAIIHNKYSR